VTLPMFVVGGEELSGNRIELTGDEGRHAAVVARVQPGDQILLTDGAGNGVGCVVRSISRHGLVAEVQVRRFEPLAEPRLVVVQAIPKGEHAERAVDLLTEVGVDTIVPWAAARNVVGWRGERADKALRRWRATAQAAAKQSRRFRFPDVLTLHSTTDVAELVRGAALGLVLHEDAPDSAGWLHDWDPPSDGEIVLVVGPEGGITDEEIEQLTGAGASLVQLGPTVLRSSAAGVVGAAAVLSRTPRWS